MSRSESSDGPKENFNGLEKSSLLKIKVKVSMSHFVLKHRWKNWDSLENLERSKIRNFENCMFSYNLYK